MQRASATWRMQRGGRRCTPRGLRLPRSYPTSAVTQVTFRRNYLEGIDDPVDIDATCNGYWSTEVAITTVDVVLCLFLSIYTAYIGYSHIQAAITHHSIIGYSLTHASRGTWQAIQMELESLNSRRSFSSKPAQRV